MESVTRIGGNETKYLAEVLSHEFHSSYSGFMVRRLEEAFAKRYGVRNAIALCNGTATLHSLLAAANLRPGDEVIVPALTMASTCLAALHHNLSPVWADVDPDTWTITADSIRERLSERTRAIITVSLYGLSPDMDPIVEFANKHKLLVIEDNAQCFLGSYKGKLAGTLGDAASFSFQSSKSLTSGEGGIIITDNDEYAEAIRSFSCLGYKPGTTKADIQTPEAVRHHRLGWNYRMSDLQAAVALAQVERMDELCRKRGENALVYFENLGKKKTTATGTEVKVIQNFKVQGGTWAFAVKYLGDGHDFKYPGSEWQRFYDLFHANGGDGPYACWLPAYKEPMFRNYRHHDCPVAEALQPKIMAFPTHYMGDEIYKQAEALRKTIESL